MHTKLRCLFACLFAATPIAVAAPPEHVGTLFYSPTERSAVMLERSATAVDADKAPLSSPAPANLALNGLVRRERGKSTVWINGQAVIEGQSLPSTPIPNITGRTVVTLGSDRLRVGETLDLNGGGRLDIVPADAVSRRVAK